MLVTVMSDIRRVALRDKFFMIVFLRVMLMGDAGDAIHRVLGRLGFLRGAWGKSGFFPGAMALSSDDGSDGKIQHL